MSHVYPTVKPHQIYINVLMINVKNTWNEFEKDPCLKIKYISNLFIFFNHIYKKLISLLVYLYRLFNQFLTKMSNSTEEEL